MDRKEAEEFVKKNRHCDHGHVVWTDGQDNEFDIILRAKGYRGVSKRGKTMSFPFFLLPYFAIKAIYIMASRLIFTLA